jgi:D-lactate dehydrogenase
VRQPSGAHRAIGLRASLVDATSEQQVRTRLLDRVAMAHDASQYILRPQAVVRAQDPDDIGRLFTAARSTGTSLTFRSGGTSLSGQSVTDGIMVDTRAGFRSVTVLDDGLRVRCGPGATVRTVNAHLRPFGRKLGPDPASEGACTIGGVVANNSSGMACGVRDNSYHTLESMTVVLPSGTTLDTGDADADERLRTLEPAIHRGLLELRDRVRSSRAMTAQIDRLFAIKNTMGYSVNAFVDHDSAVDILAHLMVGSEGTLGFISDVVLRTVPSFAHGATALLLFDHLDDAAESLPALLGAGAKTLELLDAASLRVAQRLPSADDRLRSLAVDGHAGLLVEVQEEDTAALAHARDRVDAAVDGLRLAVPADFTTDPAARARLWSSRKGLYPAISASRPVGTATLLEDIAVPVARLASTTRDLIALLQRSGYDDAVIFGHAKDGNLHFLVNSVLDDREGMLRYERFTEDLVDLVLDRGGTLKAEHGTGRVMAPFVERQFGADLYRVIADVKRLFDPAGLLNPGVIITDDPRTHLDNLKALPTVDPRFDACVDCGFCEPVCPSRDLTTTPRQRIALLRELSTAPAAERREIARDFAYAAVDTCAADSLCVLACPVQIDTGAIMKSLRRERHPRIVQRLAASAARHWAGVGGAARIVVAAAQAVPQRLRGAIASSARAVFGDEWIPLPGPEFPRAGRRRSASRRGEPT